MQLEIKLLFVIDVINDSNKSWNEVVLTGFDVQFAK